MPRVDFDLNCGGCLGHRDFRSRSETKPGLIIGETDIKDPSDCVYGAHSTVLSRRGRKRQLVRSDTLSIASQRRHASAGACIQSPYVSFGVNRPRSPFAIGFAEGAIHETPHILGRRRIALVQASALRRRTGHNFSIFQNQGETPQKRLLRSLLNTTMLIDSMRNF